MKIAEIAILSTVTETDYDVVDEPASPSVANDLALLPRNDDTTKDIDSSSLQKESPTNLQHSLPLQNLPHPESRPIYPFPVDPGIPCVHFSTNKLSRKFRQLASNPEVTVTYLDKDGAGYVVVKGEAEILSAGHSAALWRDELIIYYPEGKVNDKREGRRCSLRFKNVLWLMC